MLIVRVVVSFVLELNYKILLRMKELTAQKNYNPTLEVIVTYNLHNVE